MSVLDRPLRTRERAAVDVARAALRKIAIASGDIEPVNMAAEDALHRISVILGEKEAR